MRRDSIFYALFQQSPTLLFEFLDASPPNAENYRFDSVAVKEPKFEIDGVFLPPESKSPGVVYFCEVQFQKDEQLYERLFGESMLYFYRNRSRFSDWQAVIIYPSRSIEQSDWYPYRSLLGSDQVHRIYLNELGAIAELPLGIALAVLTTVPESRALSDARTIVERAQEPEISPELSRGIIEMVTTILIYKFTDLSRQEVQEMLGDTLQESRLYREIKEEGQQEGQQALILLQLNQKFGTLSPQLNEQIAVLNSEQLQTLAIAIFNLASLDDLTRWLETNRL